MSAIIQLTFDGALVRDGHRIAMRDLAQAMSGIQSAVDRACLDVVYGNVWKHQRLRRQQYQMAEFIVGQPTQGSYVIDFFSDFGESIVKRLKKALAEPYAEAINEGAREVYSIGHQIASRRDASQQPERLLRFEELEHTANPLITRTYGDRSINKEFDQMLTPLRREPDGTMNLYMRSSDNDFSSTYEFNSERAKRFKEIISYRQLGEPVIYEGFLRELDRGHHRTRNFRGKFINASNDKDVVIYIESEDDFNVLSSFLQTGVRFKIIASPIIEFSSFDPNGGDIQFLDIYHG